jgi:trans-2,3-dihydro-3-hydroxyanthranilate isomerase
VIELLQAFDPFAEDVTAVAVTERSDDSRRYFLLDVFTAHPLKGNQLAVFVDGEGIDSATMQALARELKLSETVFVLAAQAGGDARVRIFTPSAELPFAGHPVLGSAVLVAGALDRRAVVLETASGPVAVEVEPLVGRVGAGVMSQPIPTMEPFEGESELLDALGVERSELPIEAYRNGPRHLYVALASREALKALEPDMGALARCLGESGVSCFAGAGRRYESRMFAPGVGVPEDPATGSAAGPLAVHLARHGLIGYGEEIEIVQGVEIDRPSLLRARVDGGVERIESVRVGGSAVLLGRGEVWLPGAG